MTIFVPPVAIYRISASSFQELHVLLELVWQQVIVGIQKLDVVAMRQGEAAIASMVAAAILPSFIMNLLAEGLDDRQAVIRGAIVDDDDLQQAISLREAAVDGLAQPAGRVDNKE